MFKILNIGFHKKVSFVFTHMEEAVKVLVPFLIVFLGSPPSVSTFTCNKMLM